MIKMLKGTLLLFVFASVFGCAGLDRDFETPVVGVSSFRTLPSEGAAPKFEIGLHIVNPNRTALELEGIVYTVALNGHRILTGATSDLPVIGPYSEGDVTLTATADLLSGVSLLASLMRQPQETFTYELAARLDIGRLRPRIEVEEKGEISLGESAR